MKDRVWFEAKLVEIRQRKDQLLADWNAATGAEQFCQQAITDLVSEEATTYVRGTRPGPDWVYDLKSDTYSPPPVNGYINPSST